MPAYIRSLDGLRAIAVLLIIGFHFGYLPFGWIGVEIFFVLSGYLITSILLQHNKLALAPYLKRFYRNRILRIFPLYFLFLALLLISYKIFSRPDAFGRSWPYLLTFTINFQSFFDPQIWNYPSAKSFFHLWSLAVEEQFYLVWPFVVWFVPRKILKYLCIVLIALAPLLRILTANYFLSLGWTPDIAGVSVYRIPFLQIDSLAAGALVATLPKMSASQSASIKRASCFLLILSVIAGLANQEFLKSAGFNLPVFTFGFPHPLIQHYQEGWGYSLVAICTAVLILNLVNDNNSVRHRFLESSLMVYLGRISFGIYVFSTPIIFITESLVRLQINTLNGFFIFCAQLAVTILVAHLSFQLYEKSFLKLKSP